MDEIRWTFNRINWTLYRDAGGKWIAFSSASDSHRATEKSEMEPWLKGRGLRSADIQTLFRDVEKKGEAAVTVSRLHEPPDR
jgi:hypothetical protein